MKPSRVVYYAVDLLQRCLKLGYAQLKVFYRNFAPVVVLLANVTFYFAGAWVVHDVHVNRSLDQLSRPEGPKLL